MSSNIGWLGGWALCREAGHDTAMPARTHGHNTAGWAATIRRRAGWERQEWARGAQASARAAGG